MMVRRDFSTALGDQALDTLSSVRRLNDQWSKALKWQPATSLLNGIQHQLPESENLQ
jgi:phosphate:Na+ symporter